jgi:hypothetical protein
MEAKQRCAGLLGEGSAASIGKEGLAVGKKGIEGVGWNMNRGGWKKASVAQGWRCEAVGGGAVLGQRADDLVVAFIGCHVEGRGTLVGVAVSSGEVEGGWRRLCKPGWHGLCPPAA